MTTNYQTRKIHRVYQCILLSISLKTISGHPTKRKKLEIFYQTKTNINQIVLVNIYYL